MPRTFLISAALIALALPAAADITAQEVWQNWQETVSETGATLTAESQTSSGGTLSLAGVAYRLEVAGGAVLNADFGDIELAGRRNGTVAITTAPEHVVTLQIAEPGTEPWDMVFLVAQTGQTLTASGDFGSVSFDYSANMISVDLVEANLPDDPDLPDSIDFLLTLSGIAGSSTAVSGPSGRQMEQSFSADSADMTLFISDPEVEMNMDFTVAAITGKGTGTMPPGGTAPGSFSLADLQSAVTITFGASSTNLTAASPTNSDNLTIASAAESGRLFARFEDGSIDYGGESIRPSVTVSSSNLPIPEASIAMASASGRLRMPLAPSDEAKPFDLELAYDQLTIAETLWSLFDPGQVLPRDPINLLIDLAGTARFLVDMSDPEVMQTLSGPPALAETFRIDNLHLSLAGADLSGSGAFEIVNTPDGANFPAPTPVGAVNLQLAGINALMGKLQMLGLLPPEQIMGAQMMLTMFAVPTGDDAVTSTIEFGADGSIAANGQRLR